MDRRRFLSAAGTAATAATIGLAGCLGAAEGENDDFDVGMTAVEFVPEEYRIEVGGTVVWHNNSSRSHTVTAYEDAIPEEAAYFATGGFESEGAARDAWQNWRADPDRSGLLTSGESFSHTFEVPGTYDYVCIPHERGGMIGQIIVGK